MSLLKLCLVVGLLFAAAQPPSAASSTGRRLLQANATATATAIATADSTANSTANATANASFIAHECLWTAAAASASASAAGGDQASAEATARATAASGDTAMAVAAATATASATASSSSATATATATSAAAAGSCSLNPSFFFSLPEPRSPEERLLLKITAQRYGCLNHTSFDACASDQQNWCTWHEDSSDCSLAYDDADFPHLLLWSGAGVACEGSKMAQIVQCSYQASDSDCQAKPECSWVEGACYPGWYAQILTKPQSLAAFKRQMHTGQEAVWGSCAGADLYRRYSAICNTASQATCVADSQCEWIPNFDTDVRPNPLNFSKPCILATTKFPIESVYLTGTGNFSAAVLTAQKECLQGTQEAACVARTATLAVNVLENALSFSASTAPAAANSSENGTNAAAADATTFVAAWSSVLGDEPALLQLGDEITPGSIPLPHTDEEQPPLLSGGPSTALTSLEGASLRKLLSRLSGPLRSWGGIGRRLAAGQPAPKSCSTPSTCRAVASLTKLHIVRPKNPKAA